MQTCFPREILEDPDMAAAEGVIRNCVHCGFCTATCPTYVLLGDELDSPRGRIYLMKQMLEGGRAPSAEVVKHVDRCLSCLSCMTTCPSGVNYMHLVDHARAYIADRFRRPLSQRLLRGLLSWILPHSGRFRLALALARWVKPARRLFGETPVGAMLALTPARPAPAAPTAEQRLPATKGRIILLQGCAEPVLRPEIRAATTRLLNRAGYAVTFAAGEGCCGALVHHMGRKAAALEAARRNIDAWTPEIEGGGVVALVVTASGCGLMVKDYGYILREDPAYAERALAISALAKDISELLQSIELPPMRAPRPWQVAYHSACALQHGQKVGDAPERLLRRAGYEVATPADAHLCCGSAGTYNILQPQIATRLAERKVATLEALQPDIIATGNIGCATQLSLRCRVPVVHTVELLDWAAGGPAPPSLSGLTSLS